MGFLEQMAATSRERCQAAQAAESLQALQARALATPVPPTLQLGAFSLIAEVKFSAPSVGVLVPPGEDRADFVARQAATYAASGACAVSVLSEPLRFLGSLDDVATAAAAVHVPVMRKDFLVDPYQVWEARAAGAGGVLLILRMLDDATLLACLEAADAAGLFVLLEAFDAADLARVPSVLAHGVSVPLLVGVNTRDLSTLQVDPHRLERLAGALPEGVPCVAESGLRVAGDAGRVAAMGYRVALVGSALMLADSASELAQGMIEAGSAVP